MASSTTCCERWPLTDTKTDPLPARGLRLTGIFVGVVIIGLSAGWLIRNVGSDVEIAEVGKPAPDFTVELIDGGTFTLSDVKGKPVVLNFWASWCAPCRSEIPDISAYATAHPEVRVIGVTVNDPEVASRKFAAEIGATYPLALGTPEVEDAYPGIGLPYTVIVDADGKVDTIFTGIVNQDILEDEPALTIT